MPLTSLKALSSALVGAITDFASDIYNNVNPSEVRSSDSTLWAEASFMNLPFNTSNDSLLNIGDGVLWSIVTRSPETDEGTFYLYGGENAAYFSGENTSFFENDEIYVIPTNKQRITYDSSQWQFDSDIKVPKEIRDQDEDLVVYPNSWVKVDHVLYIAPGSYEENLLIYNLLDHTWASVEFPVQVVSPSVWEFKAIGSQCMVYNGTYIFFMGGIHYNFENNFNETAETRIFVFDVKTNKFLDNSNGYYIKHITYENDNIWNDDDTDMLAFHSCVAYESNIFMIGWLNFNNNTYSRDMYAYSFERETWIKYYDILQKSELGASYQLIGNQIYYIGGIDYQNITAMIKGEIEICTISVKTDPINTSVKCEISDDTLSLPESRVLSMSVYDEYNKYLYVVGGVNVDNGTNLTVTAAQKAYRLNLASQQVNDAMTMLTLQSSNNNDEQ